MTSTGVPNYPQTLAAGTVVGRLGPSAGPSEAIPFGTLAALITVNGTSSTSNTIGTGSKSWVTQANLPIVLSQFLLISDGSDPTNYMFGQVTAYSRSSGALTVDVSQTSGSGTFTNWTITASGPIGPQGTAGTAGGIPTGVAGGTVSVITVTITGPTTTDQQLIAVICAGANTSTTPTLNLNGGGAHTITTRGGQALVAGDIPAAEFVGIFEYNGANTRWELMNPSNRFIPSVTVLTTPGTSVVAPPAGARAGRCRVWGGGGGTGETTIDFWSGGGGGGGYGEQVFTVAQLVGLTATVGAAGLAGSGGGPSAGGNGGTSSIGGLISATGGMGAPAASGAMAGGVGGTSSATFNVTGGMGASNNYGTSDTLGTISGIGGGSYGTPPVSYNGGVQTGLAPGGGACGAAPSLPGAAGGAGRIVIEWY